MGRELANGCFGCRLRLQVIAHVDAISEIVATRAGNWPRNSQVTRAIPSVLVLGLPRGGVPVAYEVARALHAPLDVFVVRKLGVPGHRELAMGAIASGGVRILNQGCHRRFEDSAGGGGGRGRRENCRKWSARKTDYRG